MLRAVLAVLLAVALLGVALPVLEDAREERSARLVEAELDAVGAAAVDLDDAEEVADREAASRRSLPVTVPARGLAEAPVDYVAVGGAPGSNCDLDADGVDVLAYRLAGGDVRFRYVPVDLRVVGPDGTVEPDGTPLVLRGDAHLTLSLVELDGDRVVLVERDA